jgi:hypothetical protein
MISSAGSMSMVFWKENGESIEGFELGENWGLSGFPAQPAE